MNMPRVKLDYVVSFSSEDPENQARNLLSWDVGKRKWLCGKGALSGSGSSSVVLQLARAVRISSVQIGVYHAALVEVLVGRSEAPNEPFKVLVPSCVFLTPKESRSDDAVDKVRSFDSGALAADAAAQHWDRVRLVCSQPYNKHCKYGISFIHIFELESTAPVSAPAQASVVATASPAQASVVPTPSPYQAPVVPARLLALDRCSSDEDEFRPGELFAQHRRSAGATDTGAQIRQATSHALKNIPNSATQLVKTTRPNNKPATGDGAGAVAPLGDRRRDTLMYTQDDERPHTKIDHIVQRHKDERSREPEPANTPKPKDILQQNIDKTPRAKRDEPFSSENKRDRNIPDNRRERDDRNKTDSTRLINDTNGNDKRRENDDRRRERDRNDPEKRRERDDRNKPDRRETDNRSEPSTSKKDETRKRPHPERSRADDEGETPGPECSAPLRGVVFVLSGYQNPRRARLRDLAVSLGARAAAQWGPHCTHLMCAFSDTPKLREVRASERATVAGGVRVRVPVVTAAWVEACARRGRRLPWRWYATQRDDKRDPPPSPPPAPAPSAHADADDADADSECDTDDEIEKVLRKQKRARVGVASSSSSPSPPPVTAAVADGDADGDVTFVKDERMQGHVTVADSSDSADTDTESAPPAPPSRARDRALPAIFSGHMFVLDDRLAQPLDAQLLARYCTAYGGLVLSLSQVDPECDSYYVLYGRASTASTAVVRGARVRADWVWACHAQQRLCPLHGYLL